MKKKFGNTWQPQQEKQDYPNKNRVNLNKSKFGKSKYKKDDGEYVDYTELK